MLAKASDVMGEYRKTDFCHFLRALWLSGLRLSEALKLSSSDERSLCVDLSDKYPVIRIPAECQKSHDDTVLALTPDFGEFLLQTPEIDRVGFVFNVVDAYGTNRLSLRTVKERICQFGKKANVKVSTDARTGKVKYASSHDLRRAFANRRKSRVMPQTLQELMRHASIDTTMKYYTEKQAQETAKLLWEANGNTSGNSRDFAESEAK